MALKIKTFSNTGGGNVVYKALSHPLAAQPLRDLIAALSKAGPIAIFDPAGNIEDFNALHDLSSLKVEGVFVQNVVEVGSRILGQSAQPLTELKNCKVSTVFIPLFDAGRTLSYLGHLLPPGAKVVTLDEARLPDEFLTNKRNYLDPLNFATNSAFFREEGGNHTRLVTANYWAGYGAKDVSLWLRLFDAAGKELATWKENLGSAVTPVVLDSREVKKRFTLGEFTGCLFMHIIGGAGHDVVKYAVDTFGDDASVLSCTHDANAWPSDHYAGLPAPSAGEKVVLWIENTHPMPIPANSVGFNVMGEKKVVNYANPIAPYSTCAVDVSTLLPEAKWPQQIEVQAGKHFARPRYEVVSPNGRRRMAHANVQRSDLKPDPAIAGLGNLMGKGYILPAPVLPPDRYNSIVLPTPMSTCQETMPIALRVYDAKGKEVLAHSFGNLPRNHSSAVDVTGLLKKAGQKLDGGFGHMEVVYDFSAGGQADGWLHGLFRYEDRNSTHAAETSFGAHIFNTALVYKNEPQSYAGKPPGLSTRLFLRLGHAAEVDAVCHLIYPASTEWLPFSTTDILLFDGSGTEVAKQSVKIACSGSLLWRYSEMFDAATRAKAGANAYVMIRDATCRLFGYHGLMNGDKAFSLDHMFGF